MFFLQVIKPSIRNHALFVICHQPTRKVVLYFGYIFPNFAKSGIAVCRIRWSCSRL